MSTALDVNFDRLQFNLRKGKEVFKQGAVSISLGGLDTDSLVQLASLTERAKGEGWGGRRTEQALQSLLVNLDDQLVSKSPWLKLTQLQLSNESSELLSGKGSIVLNSRELPPGYISALIKNRSGDMSGFKEAVKGDVKVTLTREAERVADWISSRFGRQVRKLDGRIDVQLEKGNLTLNGQPIRG